MFIPIYRVVTNKSIGARALSEKRSEMRLEEEPEAKASNFADLNLTTL